MQNIVHLENFEYAWGANLWAIFPWGANLWPFNYYYNTRIYTTLNHNDTQYNKIILLKWWSATVYKRLKLEIAVAWTCSESWFSDGKKKLELMLMTSVWQIVAPV